MDELTLRTGFEVELLAPAGSDRQVLADELAARLGGRVRRLLPHGLRAVGRAGRGRLPAPVARVRRGRRRRASGGAARRRHHHRGGPAPGAPGRRGWYRVLCDDARLLRLVERHADPDAPLATVLEPVAELFGRARRGHRPRGPGRRRRAGDRRRGDAAAGRAASGRARSSRRRSTATTRRRSNGCWCRRASSASPSRGRPPCTCTSTGHRSAGRRPSPTSSGCSGTGGEALWAALGTNPACRRLAPLPDGAPRPAWRRAAYARGAGHRPDQVRRRQPHAARHRHAAAGHAGGADPARRDRRTEHRAAGRAGRGAAGPLPRPAPAAAARRGRHARRPARGAVTRDRAGCGQRGDPA